MLLLWFLWEIVNKLFIMKEYFKFLFFISFILVAIVLCFLVCCINITDSKIKIKLVDCIDGDTARFIIDDKEEKVRFLGIDTPESTNIQEEYGVDASNYTCDMLNSSNNIYIEYDINSDTRDKYNRVLGYIFIDDKNLSELLVLNGYAEVKYIYGDYKYIDKLCKAEYNAYKERKGIWSISDYSYKDGYCYKNGYKE